MLNDATHTRYASCPHAAGPFPYMSGGMVCMSRRLTSRLASDEHFRNFNAVAHRRNTAGTRCASPRACAAQPAASHMWHHEDAGIGYNPNPNPNPVTIYYKILSKMTGLQQRAQDAQHTLTP